MPEAEVILNRETKIKTVKKSIVQIILFHVRKYINKFFFHFFFTKTEMYSTK